MLEHSFTDQVSLLSATGAFGLGKQI